MLSYCYYFCCCYYYYYYYYYRGGSRIFFRRGCTRLLLYFNTNKLHSFCRIPVVLENRRSSKRGGGCTLPLDPPLYYFIISYFYCYITCGCLGLRQSNLGIIHKDLKGKISYQRCSIRYLIVIIVVVVIIVIILLHEKFLQSDWLRAVVSQLNLKYLYVKFTNLLQVVV